MFSLAGRSALVTGAGQGIGGAVARALAAAGAAVLVTDVDKDAAAAAAAEIVSAGGRAESAVLDVRDAGQAVRAAGQAAELTGGTLHVVVNNAGVIAPAMFGKMTAEQFQFVLDVHVGHQHGRAGRGQRPGYRPADALAGAGDERGAPGK